MSQRLGARSPPGGNSDVRASSTPLSSSAFDATPSNNSSTEREIYANGTPTFRALSATPERNTSPSNLCTPSDAESLPEWSELQLKVANEFDKFMEQGNKYAEVTAKVCSPGGGDWGQPMINVCRLDLCVLREQAPYVFDQLMENPQGTLAVMQLQVEQRVTGRKADVELLNFEELPDEFVSSVQQLNEQPNSSPKLVVVKATINSFPKQKERLVRASFRCTSGLDGCTNWTAKQVEKAAQMVRELGQVNELGQVMIPDCPFCGKNTLQLDHLGSFRTQSRFEVQDISAKQASGEEEALITCVINGKMEFDVKSDVSLVGVVKHSQEKMGNRVRSDVQKIIECFAIVTVFLFNFVACKCFIFAFCKCFIFDCDCTIF